MFQFSISSNTNQMFEMIIQGMWVLLHNAQNAPQLLLSLESILEELSATTPPDPQFRVWISSQAIPEALPVRLIQNSVRTILDSPKVCLVYIFFSKLISLY